MKSNSSFSQHNAHVREKALTAFRRRQGRRTIAKAAAVFAILTVLFAYRSRGLKPEQTIVLQIPPPRPFPPSPPRSERTSIASAETSRTQLSDDELVAAFPAGTCYIAEIGGKKRLVFRTEELRAKYFN